MKMLMALFATLLLLAACGNPLQGGPTHQEFANADFGPAPSDHRELTQQHFNKTLFDPFSAKFEFGDLEKAWYGPTGAILVSRNINYGWRSLVRINAKNRFGAYVGWNAYYVYFRGDSVVQTQRIR